MSALPSDLLPRPGRRSALPWLIAAVAFLMALAGAGALALGRSADRIAGMASGKVTISIGESDPVRRDAAVRRVLATLAGEALTTSARRVDAADVRRLVAPYFGPDGAGLPLPTLIDAELRRGVSLARLQRSLQAIPSVRADGEAEALKPLLALIEALYRLAVAVLLLATTVAVLVTMLAARAALAAHGATIETLHGLGATDMQLARLVERRSAVDALAGAALGLLPAAGIILLVARQLGALNGKTGAERLPIADWSMLAILPLILAGVALLATRLTIVGQLKRSL